MKILNTPQVQYLQSKINRLPSGRYEISEILAEDWSDITCPAEYGRQVRRTVALNRLKGIKPIGRKSNNHLVYEIIR